ncbi:hypothetical protein B0H10DRAFT_1968382 [Mycena sp. CBHHK59/15]|nr:hypothetical protein B0H10DRAFT_1968382 [Mycena sp. CBHHK59/15]
MTSVFRSRRGNINQNNFLQRDDNTTNTTMASGWTSNQLGLKHFHQGSEMQNASHWRTYCKGCIKHKLDHLKEEHRQADTLHANAATHFTNDKEDFKHACDAVGSLRGEKTVWITHVLGTVNRKSKPCPHVSQDTTTEATRQRNLAQEGKDQAPTTSAKHARSASATESNDATTQKKFKQTMLKTYTGLDMPFHSSEAATIEAQALRTIVSTNSAFRLFEDPEMLTLFGMMRSHAPEIIPSGKVVGGRLLDEASITVGEKISMVLKGEVFGFTDSWKSLTNDAVNGVCTSVDYKSYTIELVDVTSMDKSGPSMCQQFCDIIDRVEAKYDCIIIYFVTDANSGSKKGRQLLGKKCGYLILPSCWAHQFQLILADYLKVNKFGAQTAEMTTALIGWINNHGKVRKIFDRAQQTISLDRLGCVLILAYLIANLTRWTTHCIAFMRVFRLQDALQFAVMQSRSAIIAAQVGAAKGAEKDAFTAEADKFCNLLMIQHSDLTRADQVLLSLVGMFLRMVDHPEPEVASGMTARLERRWKDCDQPLFLLTLILNPFEQLSCFSPKAALNHFNCLDLLVLLHLSQVGADIKSDHLERGLVTLRTARNVHKSTAEWLTVPCYRDLLDDQDDEDSTGGKTALVSTVAGWRTVMKRWIDNAQAAAEDTDSFNLDDNDTDISPGPSAKPSLAELFCGSKKKHAERLSQDEIDAEASLMVLLAEAEAIAEAEEDAQLDDGAVEIASDDEYNG